MKTRLAATGPCLGAMWSDVVAGDVGDVVDLIALDDALDKLGMKDERKAQVVMLRYFVGLNFDEVAESLGISKNTAKRDWDFCKVWLQRELNRTLKS